MQPNKMFPANLLKFNAYLTVVDSLEAAIDVIKKKRLAYGEPCVVTYNIPAEGSSDKPVRKVLFGIGSLDPKDPWFFNVEYGKDGKPVEQTELLEKMEKIVEEWDEHGGFTTTAIKYSKTEPSNINDTEFAFGDIILGEAAVKRVLDVVSKNSKDLVTSKGIYDFVNNLISAIETELKDVTVKTEKLTADVSTLKNDVSVIKVGQNKLIKDVSVLKADVSALKNDVSVIKVGQSKLTNDVSTLKNDVSVIKVGQNKLANDVSVLKETVTVIKTDTSTLKNDVSVIKVGQNKLTNDVSALKADVSALKASDASSLVSVVSDSSIIKVTIANKTARLNVDLLSGFSVSFMQNEDEKIALAWNKYEE